MRREWGGSLAGFEEVHSELAAIAEAQIRLAGMLDPESQAVFEIELHRFIVDPDSDPSSTRADTLLLAVLHVAMDHARHGGPLAMEAVDEFLAKHELLNAPITSSESLPHPLDDIRNKLDNDRASHSP